MASVSGDDQCVPHLLHLPKCTHVSAHAHALHKYTTTGFSSFNPAAARLLDDGTAGASGAQQGDGGRWMVECWGALTELRSCTDEIILFFFGGESYLGRACCLAIRTVARHCSPNNSLASIIDFTAEEAGVLRGFCDAAEVGEDGTPAAGARPPAAAPAPSEGVFMT